MKRRAPKSGIVTATRSLEPGDWELVTRLFGTNGACGGCWCMWPRLERGGKLWEEMKGARNRNALRRLIRDGRVHAVIALAGEEVVGWCSFGPRGDFPRLLTIRDLEDTTWEEDTWSIVCFFVPARWRGQGVATALLEAATARAFALGAREVEGYPRAPKSAAEVMPAAFVWMGVSPLFSGAGFRPRRRPPGKRPIYVRRAPRRTRS